MLCRVVSDGVTLTVSTTLMNMKPAINPRHMPIVPTIVSCASPALLRSRLCMGRMLCVLLQHHCRVITSGLGQSWSCSVQCNVQTNRSTTSSLVEGSVLVRSDKIFCRRVQQIGNFNVTLSLLLGLSRSGPHNPACLSFRENFAPRYMHCHSDRAMRRSVFHSVLSVCLSQGLYYHMRASYV